MKSFTKSNLSSKYKTLSIGQLRKCLFITACGLCTNTIAAISLNKTYVDKDRNLESKQSNWTGFYAGGVLGGLWGNNNTTWNPLPSPLDFAANQITGNNNSSGVIGGILAGYNYQFTKNGLK